MPTGAWFERQANGSILPLTFLGRYLGKNESGANVFESVDLVRYPEAVDPSDFLPLSPSISLNQTSRTSVTGTIAPADNLPPRSAVLTWQVWQSLNGATATLVDTLPAGTLTWTDASLPTSTPENTFTYTVRGINTDGPGAFSNAVSVQWSAPPVLQQPVAPTGLSASAITDTSITLTWNIAADSSVTDEGIFVNGSLFHDGMAATSKTHVLTNLAPNTTYTNMDVRRYNGWAGGSPPGWSPPSNAVSPKTLPGATGGPLFQGHQPGKVFLGWSTDQGDAFADKQLDTFTPGAGTYSDGLGVRRLYNYNATDVAYADAHGRMVLLSAKAPDFGGSAGVAGWAQVANGSLDAGIKSYFQPVVNRNKVTFFVFHHEPVGDISNVTTDPVNYVNAFKRIIQVVDATYPGNKMVFGPNYEENRLRNLKVGGATLDWSLWLPQNMISNRKGGGWDLITWDCYQYNATTSTTAKAGVQFSHRWWRIHDLFTGGFVPAGSSPMPWMTYKPGVDVVFGICEGSARPGTFYSGTSDMTGAKYARDYLDYVFNNPGQFAFVSWFNSIGADPVYNEERLVPLQTSSHPDFTTQTGDTERSIDIYREKLNSGLTAKPVL